MVEEAPRESRFQVASLVAGRIRNDEGRLRAGSRAHPSWATPAPASRARRAGAGPEGGAPEGRGAGGRYPSDSRRLRLGAERQSLSATPRVTAPQQRWVPAAAFAPPLPLTPPPPCPTSPVPGRCAAARISTSSSRRWVSWCGGYVPSVKSSCEAHQSQRGWPGEVQAGGSQWSDESLFPLRSLHPQIRISKENGLRTQGVQLRFAGHLAPFSTVPSLSRARSQ